VEADPLVLPACAALLAWAVLALLPARPWACGERLDSPPAPDRTVDLSDITVVIPARDEAASIGNTLAALAAQGRGHRVLVIDDQSTDATAAIAAGHGAEVISGQSPPPGWTGKLWALEQGRQRLRTPLLLQLDADIELQPGVLAALRERLYRQDLDLVSIMALLPTVGWWQRLVLPAYVWFFKLLYPFALANGPRRAFAAAAGGLILLRRQCLERIGGYRRVGGAVIDDCALAAACKRAGGRLWLGLSREVISRRQAGRPGQLLDLVARTAYTQLRHSPALVLVVSVLLLVMFWAPPLAVVFGTPAARWTGLAAWLLLATLYQPLLAFYRLNRLWGVLLPVTALFYLCAIQVSAWRGLNGSGVQWKNRHYTRKGAIP